MYADGVEGRIKCEGLGFLMEGESRPLVILLSARYIEVHSHHQ